MQGTKVSPRRHEQSPFWKGLGDPKSVPTADGDQAQAKGGASPGIINSGADLISSFRHVAAERENPKPEGTSTLCWHWAEDFIYSILSNLPSSTGRQNSHFTDVKTDMQSGVSNSWLVAELGHEPHQSSLAPDHDALVLLGKLRC